MPLLLPVISAFLITLMLTPLARQLALRVGLVDLPNHRRINSKPMPSGGGLAIFVSFFLTAWLLGGGKLLPLFLGGTIILLVGLADDFRGLSPGMKLIGQIGAALAFVLVGPRIEFLTNPFGGMLYVGQLAVPLTVLWIVSVINVINFIDGMDGLASGIVSIAGLALFAIAYDFGWYQPAVAILIMVGATVGFLPFNFNPAKIILGDAGAMFLGFLVAALATEGALKGAATIGMAIPTLILALPVFDTLCAIIRRVQQGIPFYQADRQHFHHRLLELGLNQRQVALFAYTLSVATATVALYLVRSNSGGQLIVGIVVAVFFWGGLRVGLFRAPVTKSQRRVF